MATYSTLNTVVAYASLYGLDLNSLAYVPNPVDGGGGEGDATASGTGASVNSSSASAESEDGTAANHGFFNHLGFALSVAGGTQDHASADPGKVAGNDVASGSNAASVANSITYTYSTFDLPGASSMIYGGVSINNDGKVIWNYTGSDSLNYGLVYNDGSYSTINFPGSTGTVAFAINDEGQVAGFYYDNTEPFGHLHGYIYSGSSYTAVDFPGSADTLVYSINDTGEVAGNYIVGGSHHGFVYDGNNYTSIDVPGSVSRTDVSAINDSGRGRSTYYDTGGIPHAFLYNGGSYTTLDPPNDFFPTQSISTIMAKL